VLAAARAAQTRLAQVGSIPRLTMGGCYGRITHQPNECSAERPGPPARPRLPRVGRDRGASSYEQLTPLSTEQEEEMGKHKKWWWVCRCGFVVTEVVYLSVLDVASCPECGARYQTFTRSCHGPGIERAGREKNGRDE